MAECKGIVDDESIRVRSDVLLGLDSVNADSPSCGETNLRRPPGEGSRRATPLRDNRVPVSDPNMADVRNDSRSGVNDHRDDKVIRDSQEHTDYCVVTSEGDEKVMNKARALNDCDFPMICDDRNDFYRQSPSTIRANYDSRGIDYNAHGHIETTGNDRRFVDFKRKVTTSTPLDKTELKHLREELNLLQKQYRRERLALPDDSQDQLGHSPVNSSQLSMPVLTSEKEYLSKAIQNFRQKLDDVRHQAQRLGNDLPELKFRPTVGTSDRSVQGLFSMPLLEPTPVRANIMSSSKRMPSFGKESEYLEKLTGFRQRPKILFDDSTTGDVVRRPRRKPIELSQGRDVTSSQEERNLEMLAAETSDSEENSDEFQSHTPGNLSFTPDRSGSRRLIRTREPTVISETSSSDDDTSVKSKKPSHVHSFSEDVHKPSCISIGRLMDDKIQNYYETDASRSKVWSTKRGTGHGSSSSRRDSGSSGNRKKKSRNVSRKKTQVPVSSEDNVHERNSSVRRDYLKLEKYDGTTPLEVFLYQFDNCSEYNRWTEVEKLANLKGALKGTAAQVLLGTRGSTCRYAELRDELSKCFGVEGHTAQFRALLKARRRQPDESLRALYQDICRLLLLAYPGPQTELRDQLAVEAFTDSLDEPELEIRVKDRFPNNLAEAFQIALRLEANKSKLKKDIEGKREKTKSYRTDVEARHVEWQEERYNDRLKNLEQDLRESRDRIERLSNEKKDAQIRELQNRIQTIEIHNKTANGYQESPENARLVFDECGRGNESYKQNGLVNRQGNHSPAINRMQGNGNLSSEQHRQFSRNSKSSPRDNQDVKSIYCYLCRSSQHLMSNCPQAVCGGCNQAGHTRRICPRENHSPNNSRFERTDNHDMNRYVEEKFKNNATAIRRNMVRELEFNSGNRAYLEMDCLGIQRRFLLDSGCDVTLFPAKYVEGARLLPTVKRAFAANATEIDLKGEVQLDLRIGHLHLPTRAIVSDNVDEGLIGYDWLAQHDVFWGFGLGRICIGNEIISLAPRDVETIRCCRVVVQENVVVPPFSEAIIPSKVVYGVNQIMSTPKAVSERHDFMIEPRETESGLSLAGSLIPHRCHNIPARVINTSCRSVRLTKEDDLGELRELKLNDVLECPARTEESASSGEWLDKIMNEVHSSITLAEKRKLRQILEEYSDCFSKHELDLGRTSVVTHSIDTGNSRPIKQVLRRHPYVHLEEIDRQVKDMLQQDVIEQSSSPWASNVVIVKKKDGSLRFCIDYRKLNDVTIKDSYPLPRISDCLDALSTGKYFSAFDLRSGYFQVAMEESDKEKTSFITRSGTYQFKVLPFGVTNGPATFQRLMDLTMTGLNYQICLVYLDDIILMSRTVEEHLERLVLILDRLRNAGLKLKPSKCKILQKTISFLGHIVSDQGIATDSEKVKAVEEWPTPKNVTEVRSFVGLCSYYRRFVKDFAWVAGPLHGLTGKRAHFEWNEKCQQAFEELKNRLVSSPILAMPEDEGTFRLDTDASNESIGAVLSQVQDGQERVIAYASRLLTKPERNYCVTRRELLAVVYFIKQFRVYLLGRHFLLRTDHAALRWLRKMPEPIGQQARWLEVMEEFSFDIEHRPGKKHANADALSRRPCRQCTIDEETPGSDAVYNVRIRKVEANNEEDEENISGNPDYFQSSQMEQDYSMDPQLSTFHAIFTTSDAQVPWNEVVGLDRITKNLWNQWDRISAVDGVLYRKWTTIDGLNSRWQLIPPKSIQTRLIQIAHTGMTGGHLGIKRTQHQLQLRAYWPGWAEDVVRYCHRCTECTTYHRGQPNRQGVLQSFPVGEPFERIAIDLTGPHPTSRSGHVYMLTIVDIFTKWAEAIPIRNKEAVTVARALMDVVISRFGVPMQILSDNGREFDNSILRELCRLLDIDKVRTTAYKPSTNGAVERFHRTLNSMLGKVVATNQKNWDEFLPSVMAAYRASRHEATGYSPNFLMLGREITAPLDVVFGVPEGEEAHYASYDEFADRRIEIMRKSYQLARESLGVSAERGKRYYDVRVRPRRYQVGQWVFYYCPRRYNGRSPKWQRLYSGPFLITKVMGPVNVQLQASPRSQPFISHIDKLKACLGDTPRSWINEAETVEQEVTDEETGVVFAPNRMVEHEHEEPEVRELEYVINPLQEARSPEVNVHLECDDASRVSMNQRPKRAVRRPRRFDDYT